MPITLKEGQVGEAVDCIQYPEVNSCLTITYITPEGHLYGGHAVAVPVHGQKTLNDVIEYIRPHVKRGGKLLLLGVLSVWHGDQLKHFSNGKYSDLKMLENDLLKGLPEHVTEKNEKEGLITVYANGSFH
jgi:hypothetical protein